MTLQHSCPCLNAEAWPRCPHVVTGGWVRNGRHRLSAYAVRGRARTAGGRSWPGVGRSVGAGMLSIREGFLSSLEIRSMANNSCRTWVGCRWIWAAFPEVFTDGVLIE